MRRYLVVANQTLGGQELVDLIVKRAKSEPSEFVLVAPATPVIEFVQLAAMPVMGGFPTMPDSPAQARRLAEERLQQALTQLQAAGVKAEGRVGDPDPLRAAETMLKARQFDEVIISTLPNRVSGWLRQDLPRRLERRCGMPVTHVEKQQPE